MFEFVKEYYLLGLFTNEDLEMYVECGWITSKQMQSLL